MYSFVHEFVRISPSNNKCIVLGEIFILLGLCVTFYQQTSSMTQTGSIGFKSGEYGVTLRIDTIASNHSRVSITV